MDWKNLPGEKRKKINFMVNGKACQAGEGQSLGAALYAQGYLILGRTIRENQPRSLFCGMGVCHSCLVTIDGVANQRSCMHEVKQGMKVNLDED